MGRLSRLTRRRSVIRRVRQRELLQPTPRASSVGWVVSSGGGGDLLPTVCSAWIAPGLAGFDIELHGGGPESYGFPPQANGRQVAGMDEFVNGADGDGEEFSDLAARH